MQHLSVLYPIILRHLHPFVADSNGNRSDNGDVEPSAISHKKVQSQLYVQQNVMKHRQTSEDKVSLLQR